MKVKEKEFVYDNKYGCRYDPNMPQDLVDALMEGVKADIEGRGMDYKEAFKMVRRNLGIDE